MNDTNLRVFQALDESSLLNAPSIVKQVNRAPSGLWKVGIQRRQDSTGNHIQWLFVARNEDMDREPAMRGQHRCDHVDMSHMLI